MTKGIELASPLLERRGQFLEVEVPDGGLRVHGDLDRLAQVVSNLLTQRRQVHAARAAASASAGARATTASS